MLQQFPDIIKYHTLTPRKVSRAKEPRGGRCRGPAWFGARSHQAREKEVSGCVDAPHTPRSCLLSAPPATLTSCLWFNAAASAGHKMPKNTLLSKDSVDLRMAIKRDRTMAGSQPGRYGHESGLVGVFGSCSSEQRGSVSPESERKPPSCMVAAVARNSGMGRGRPGRRGKGY